MSDNLLKLYPQTQATTADRRQQSISVDFERRSGKDRRLEQRKNLAPEIKNDVNKVKTRFDEVYAAFKEYDNLTKPTNDYFSKNLPSKTQKIQINKELIDLALSPIPMARRLVNIENNKESDNKFKVLGLLAIAATNVKEDLRDLMTIFGRAKSEAPKGYYTKYGFLVGTTIEEKLQKAKNGKAILKLDKTIGETVFDNFIKNTLKVKITRQKFNKEITHLNGNVEKVIRRHIQIEGGGKIAKLIALSLYRIPKLSVIAAALLEIPTILKTKNKDKLKQITNSALSVGLGISCGAICSALLAPISPALPVIGLGVGYYIGNKLSKTIGFKINAN